MKSLRRILITAVAAVAVSGIASADTIIGYTITTASTATDLNNVLAQLPSWNPGDANNTTSNVAGNGYITGIAMSSLTGPSTYTLVGYNITVKETLTGNYILTNSSTSSSATGTSFIDSYTAVGLNSTLGFMDNTHDATGDLYNCSATNVGLTPCVFPGEQVSSTGGGPDPNAPSSGAISLGIAGGGSNSYTSPSINVNSKFVDYGCEILGNGFSQDNNVNQAVSSGCLLTTGLGAVSTVNPLLSFYFKTATEDTTTFQGGNNSTQYNTSVTEQVTVTYDYIVTSATPEPTTMVLFGSALVGLGLIRKRVRR